MPAIEYELETSVTEGGAELKLAILRFNRPQAHNAFDPDAIGQLREALERAAGDSSVRGVLLTGEGRAFCTGADVKQLHRVAAGKAGRAHYQPGGTDGDRGSSTSWDDLSAGQRLKHHLGLLMTHQHACIMTIRRMAKPVVAALNGVVAGGGLPLALACDYRLAVDTARFKGSYFGVGVVPDGGITWLLPRLVGMARAQELLLLDRELNAREALGLGLVQQLCHADELCKRSRELLSELAARPSTALGRLKLLLNQTYDSSLEEQLMAERYANLDPDLAAGLEEGVAAFVAQRKPDFVRVERGGEVVPPRS